MDFREWEPYYQQILEDFGFDRARDEEAARMLSRLLQGKETRTKDLSVRLRGQEATVLGNSPHLADQLSMVGGVVIAADEALSVAREAGVKVDILVTDLDGTLEDQLAANTEGTVAVIHAHGDNMEALERWVPSFRGPIVGTTQSRPLGNVHDFGGFTDGDRAVFMAAHFRGGPITLLGFDFEKPNPKDQPEEVKRRKLAWAKRLIGVVGESATIRFPSSSS